MRDNNWLSDKLNQVWQKYFRDTPKLNTIVVSFGYKAKRRLGSIRQINPIDKFSRTKITITSYFKEPAVPEYVIETTLAHEICHYAHGFASPLLKYSRYPHHGGIVDKELKDRGLGAELTAQKMWLKTEWPKLIGEAGITYIRRRRCTHSRSNTLIDLVRLFGI